MITSTGTAMVCAGVALFAGALQEPQVLEFRHVVPTGMAQGMTVTESHDLLLVGLETRRGADDRRDTQTSLRMRTRVDALFADEHDRASGRVRRRYVALAGSIQLVDPASVDEASGEWNGTEFALESRLVGVSVAFQPAPGQPAGFGRHYDAKALREPLLPRLTAPVDWSTFLPPKGADGVSRAALGDEWKCEPKLLRALIAPAGFLAWRGGEDSDPQILRAFASGVGGNLHLGFDGEVKGDVSAKIAKVDTDPEHGLYAEIEFAYDIVLRADRTDFVDEQRLEREVDASVEMLSAQLSVHLKGGATLRWAIEGQRPIAAFVAADESVTMTVSVLPPDGEAVEQTMRMTGGLVNGLKFREMPLVPVTRGEGR